MPKREQQNQTDFSSTRRTSTFAPSFGGYTEIFRKIRAFVLDTPFQESSCHILGGEVGARWGLSRPPPTATDKFPLLSMCHCSCKIFNIFLYNQDKVAPPPFRQRVAPDRFPNPPLRVDNVRPEMVMVMASGNFTQQNLTNSMYCTQFTAHVWATHNHTENRNCTS